MNAPFTVGRLGAASARFVAREKKLFIIDPALPFGGFRQSGWRREMGWSAIELYTETKSIGAAL